MRGLLRVTVGRSQLVTPFAALTAAAALATLAPRPATASSAARGHDPDPPAGPLSPKERALGVGVVALRSPASQMIRIAAGVFDMGSTLEEVLDAVAQCAREPLGRRCREEMFSDELPRRRVRLSGYWLDRTEVTVRDYSRCVALRRCKPVPFDQGGKRFDRPSYPVSLVRHSDAEAYCRFRGGRLPTEAELERAARGPKGRRYPWGNLYNSRAANHGRLGIDQTDASDGFAEIAPVGSFPSGRTADGFLDLAGNVAEWAADRYAAGYPPGPAVNPKGPGIGAGSGGYVVRGGHFASAAPWLRSASRASADPETRTPMLGFRCARSDRPRVR